MLKRVFLGSGIATLCLIGLAFLFSVGGSVSAGRGPDFIGAVLTVTTMGYGGVGPFDGAWAGLIGASLIGLLVAGWLLMATGLLLLVRTLVRNAAAR